MKSVKCQRFLTVFLFIGAIFLWPRLSPAVDFQRVELADGFDYPVGKPNGDGYYKARGYTPNGHLGEDWNGRGGGDTDLGDPIYSTANGIVVVSQNIGKGWGNCIIVRHAYREPSGKLSMVDSQYGHLLKRIASVGDIVKRGQLIATMGGNNGMYPVHLHFEMRKNLQIGMNRMDFARDNSNYYSPTAFIEVHRTCPVDIGRVEIPINNFAAYGQKLDTVDPKPYLRRGYSIPVYRAPAGAVAAGSSLPPPSAAEEKPRKPPPEPEASSFVPTRTQVPVPKVADAKPRQATPEAAAKPDTGGFWSRLKAKFKRKPKDEPQASKS